MRTTVRLDNELLSRAKIHAARHHRTLTSVIEEGLRLVLAADQRNERRARIALPVSRRDGGPRPGIDLDDTSTLLDELDDTDAAP